MIEFRVPENRQFLICTENKNQVRHELWSRTNNKRNIFAFGQVELCVFQLPKSGFIGRWSVQIKTSIDTKASLV